MRDRAQEPPSTRPRGRIPDEAAGAMAPPPAQVAQVAAATAHAATGSPRLVGSDHNSAIHGFMECGERYPRYSIPALDPPDSRPDKHRDEIA